MSKINRDNEKACEEYIRKNWKYDPESGKIYSELKNKEIGSIDKSTGYKKLTIIINNKNAHFQFHRVAWFLYYNVWPEKTIDHINQNKFDNRIVNLRECTQQQNNRNVSKRKNNTSGYKNVCKLNKNGKCWQLNFTINGKVKYFGVYSTPEEANKAARKIEKEIYKDFAPTKSE